MRRIERPIGLYIMAAYDFLRGRHTFADFRIGGSKLGGGIFFRAGPNVGGFVFLCDGSRSLGLVGRQYGPLDIVVYGDCRRASMDR